MKKFINSKLFIVIITAVICISGTAFAASELLAKDVDYTPLDNEWKATDGTDITNVKEAIDDLHKRISNMELSLMYEFAYGTPANYSYTFPAKTKNVLVVISSIRDSSIGESDSTISLPSEYTTLYDLEYGESFGSGRTGIIHTRVYFMNSAEGTISGRISYRGMIKVFQIN